MGQDKLYLKAEQIIEVTNTKVYLEDVVKLYSSNHAIVKELNQTLFMSIKKRENAKYCISLMKVIETISKKYPDVEIINLGESDFIIYYVMPQKPNNFLEYAKVVGVALIVFFGAAFTIMTFNTDVNVAEVFDKAYELATGHSKADGTIVEIAYSIGMPIGTLVFYNHLSKKKKDTDPTPIQIEMRKYETDINKAVIDDASREGKTIDAD